MASNRFVDCKEGRLNEDIEEGNSTHPRVNIFKSFWYISILTKYLLFNKLFIDIIHLVIHIKDWDVWL